MNIPYSKDSQYSIYSYENDEMNLRDWFAVTASEEDLQEIMPHTVGEYIEVLYEMGLLTKEEYNLHSFNYSKKIPDYRIRVRTYIRYKFADKMLEERNKEKS